MSKKKSHDPVVRAEAELEEAVAEMNAIADALKIPEQNDTQLDESGQEDREPEVTNESSQQAQQEDENSETYKQRWSSLQGQFKYLQAQVYEKDRYIQQLTADVERLKAQPPAQTPHDGSVTPDELESLATRISEQYGDDLGKPFEKLTKYMKKLEGEVAANKQQAAPPQTQQANTVDPREMYLTQLCPQWQQLNYDETFISWLNSKAPYSNKTLGQQLNAAYDGGDVEGAAEIFNGYLREQSQRQAKPDTRAQLQAPASRGSNQPAGNQTQKFWTEKEVNAFYKSIQNGVYRGTAADQAATESEIHLAYLEGRVR